MIVPTMDQARNAVRHLMPRYAREDLDESSSFAAAAAMVAAVAWVAARQEPCDCKHHPGFGR